MDGRKMDMKRSYTKWIVLFCIIGVLAAAGTYMLEQSRTADSTGDMQIHADADGGVITVTVSGEVEQPGSYQIPASGRYSDAIYAAGGATQQAYIDPTLLDEPLADGAEVVIGSVQNAPVETPESGKKAPEQAVNLNTAGKAELMQLPGVGEVTADRIIAYREQYGGFDKIQELMNVSGIGEKKFAQMEPYVTVEQTAQE